MKRMLTVLGLGLAISLPGAAAAMSACGERDTIIQRLESKWGEHLAAGGMQDANNIYEVWMSKEKGTWTILRTSANGRACVMASGTDWHQELATDKTLEGVKG